MMNPSIFIASYPNTEEKIKILKECINSVKKSGFPVVAVSNLVLPEEISSIVEECLIGKNEECKYRDFFTDEEIDKARNSSKYLLHFTPSGGETISHRPFYYGRGSTYHWAGLTQQVEIVNYSKQNGISHALILEGDVVLDEKDILKIQSYFSKMEEEKLDFIVAMQNNFGHMAGNGWFTRIDYWEKVCIGMSAEDFLRSTYPNFSSEGYVIDRMKKSGGRGEILSFENQSPGFPDSWVLSKKDLSEEGQGKSPINLFFPATNRVHLSFNLDRKDQSHMDPLQYVHMGTGKMGNMPIFFIWNRYNGETVIEIKAKISVFNGEIQIFNSEYNLSLGHWAWTPIFNLKRDSHCTVEIVVIEVNGEEFHFSDRFGSVGNSINMRDLILE